MSDASKDTDPDATQLIGPPPTDLPGRTLADGAAPTAKPPPPVVPGYQVIEEVGAGAAGVVYKARHLGLGRLVAIKVLRAGARAGAAELARFRAEAQAAARLQHPNIVQVFEVGHCGDCPYIALEFVDGGSLDRRLTNPPIAPPEAAALAETLARAVHAAHKQGVVHRDLKPGNVLLTTDGHPKITDFGLAKRLEGGSEQTKTGMILGTPCYMAPEQAEAKKEVGPAADVYSLGAILYELLAGRPPFSAESALDTIRQVVERDPVAPRTINPAVPRDLETICLKALAKEPPRRYPSAAEMADDLGRYLRGEPIRAKPAGRLGRVARWCRRNPQLAGLSALTFILSVVVIALTLRKAPPAEPPADDSLKRVQEAGRLRIATDPTYPPMEFREGGELKGFGIDLGRETARRLGVQAEFVVLDAWDWKDVVRRLDAGEFDAVISTITITEERQHDAAFVEYLRVPLVFVCRDGVAVRHARDLAGRAVAVQKDTTAEKLVDSLAGRGINPGKVLRFAAAPEPFAAVRDGKADVIIVDEPVARYFVGRDKGLAIMGATGHAMDPDPLGIVLRRGDRQLRGALADAVRAMRDDDTFSELLRKWFGE